MPFFQNTQNLTLPDALVSVCIKKVNVRSAFAKRPPTFSVSVPASSTLLLLLILCTNPASKRHSWIIHNTVKSARRKQKRENEEIPKQAQHCAQHTARGSNSLRPLLKVHSPVPASLSSGRKKKKKTQQPGQCSVCCPCTSCTESASTHSCPLTSGSQSK